MKMTNERKNYIEYRVHLKPGCNRTDIDEIAEQLKDIISDEISDSAEPDVFTEDVTYQVVISPDDND
jgi:hypothetical protein